jgi:uncharacterized protein
VYFVKAKKMPMRKCVGCNEQKPKKELIRVVRNKDDEVFIDVTGKANGRGAYVCPEAECLGKAMKRDALSRALEIKISKELYMSLQAELEAKKADISCGEAEDKEDER